VIAIVTGCNRFSTVGSVLGAGFACGLQVLYSVRLICCDYFSGNLCWLAKDWA